MKYFDFLNYILEYYAIPNDETILCELLDIEVQYEISISVLNKDAMPVLCELKTMGKRIIAISDMYLPKKAMN